MKYYTKSLWEGINHCDEAVRKQSEAEWAENDQRYHQYFQTIKKHLPARFLKLYAQHNGFHDYDITKISIISERGCYICKLELTDINCVVTLEMGGVTSFKVSVDDINACVNRQPAWGYNEFEYIGKNRMRLSVICDIDNEMRFDFRTIKATEKILPAHR